MDEHTDSLAFMENEFWDSIFALCSFVCQSKVEVSKIIEDGLDLIEAEG